MTHFSIYPSVLRNLFLCYHDVQDLSNAKAAW